MTRIIDHVRGNLVAYLALFVALGGTSYAAVQLPAGSVGARELKNRSITAAKLNPASIAGSVAAWARVNANGQLFASRGEPKLQSNPFAPPGYYTFNWKAGPFAKCAVVATVTQGSLGYATATGVGHQISVTTYGTDGRPAALPFSLAAIC
jgi:hypothetical protein